jgi:hypothetical protein
MVKRLVIILWTCLSLLVPHGAALAAACDHASESACCASECSCCTAATETHDCCCEGDDAPAPAPEHGPAPTGPASDLERALCLPGPVLHWAPAFGAHELRSSHAPRCEGPVASGRSLLRQGCRLRH